MEVLIELFKAFHFLGMLFFFLAFSLWIREEFITIFNRKKIAGPSVIKVLLIRVISENNGLYINQNTAKGTSLIYYFGTVFGAILPLFFVQMSDRFDFLGSEVFLGLIGSEKSWLYFFSILPSPILNHSVDLIYISIYNN